MVAAGGFHISFFNLRKVCFANEVLGRFVGNQYLQYFLNSRIVIDELVAIHISSYCCAGWKKIKVNPNKRIQTSTLDGSQT